LAEEARKRAYSPYSQFAVGAALQLADGRVVTGCNVENLSFGLTICAERVCVGSAIAAGDREFAAIAVAADTVDPVMPCGACRQVLAEFNPKLKVISATASGKRATYRLDTLLPMASQGILQRPDANNV
jgi:cytidine deaminase